uniref:Uncharacterized protein n=1 Tax=Ralstonia solanacearum TaxID=305 RepID=A0A0S4U9W1_RALSL|nr:protein of unknown function [Ralstonia solanacearum]
MRMPSVARVRLPAALSIPGRQGHTRNPIATDGR